MGFVIFQHVKHETPGLFADVADKMNIKYLLCKVFEGDELPALEDIDGLLILGGPMGVRDILSPTYPWLKKEVDLIRECYRKKIPILGVCLGAQILAYIAGGSIGSISSKISQTPGYEVGWSPIILNPDAQEEPTSKYFHPHLDALHWHSDRILLPKKATLIASTDLCKEQFFRIGKYSYGLQFHIEIDNNCFFKWLEEDRDFIVSALGIDAVDILINQHSKFSESSKSIRLEFISYLLKSLFL